MRFSLTGAAVAVASFFALASFAPSARAFCRTITVPVPADYDPSTGCYQPPAGTPNIPLYWSNACVGYSLQKDASKQVTLDVASSVAAKAFARWSAYTCKAGGNPSIDAVDEGPVDCGAVEYNQDATNQHVVVFRDASWPHDDPNNTLALTTVTFDTQSGEIYDADMEINSADNKLSTKTPAPTGAFDLDSILTHEAGHFLGLAHSPNASAVMYAHYKPGSVNLTSDDGEGICTIDPPGGTRATAAGSIAESSCDPTPRHGFGTGCGGAGAVASASTSSASSGGGCATAPGRASSGGGALAWMAAIGASLIVARRKRGAIVSRMRRTRAWLLAAFVATGTVGAASFFARDASASVSISVLFDDLVQTSTAAAVVTPIDQQSVWEDGRIYTYTHVHVDDLAAGSLGGDEAWIRTMGGTVGHIGQLVDGEAVLTVGRPALLFLQPLVVSGQVTTTFDVTARAQGQFPVVLDEAKRPKIIRAGGVGALVEPPRARIDRVVLARTHAGLPAKAELARDVLHGRPVKDALHTIADAWARLHATK